MKAPAAALLALLAAPAFAASFDCAKAGTRVEKLVCADPALGALDERVAAAFKAIGPEPAGSEWGRWQPRVDDQRRWLRTVRDKCADAACLQAAYTQRLAELERWHRPASADDTVAGVYRVDHTVAIVGEENLESVDVTDCLSLVPRSGGEWDLEVESAQTNGHSCSVSGRAHRTADDVLRRVPDTDADDGDGCRLEVHVENGELRLHDPDGQCQYWCGARAHLDGLVFPRSTRQPDAVMACADPDAQ